MVVAQQLMAAVRRVAEAREAEEDRQALRYALHAQRLEEAHAYVVSLGPASTSSSDDYGPIADECENDEWEDGA